MKAPLTATTKKRPWIGIPAWILIGAVLVLVPIFVFITLESINRQKENTIRLLVEKGAALIRSFEAGARTGMMGMDWGGLQVQRLLMETAQQPDIRYLLVTNRDGIVLAHNDISKIGTRYGKDLDFSRISRSRKLLWRQVSLPNGELVFEVFRQFSPTRGMMMFRNRNMTVLEWWQRHLNPEGPRGDVRQVIFVGLDMQAVESARRQDMRHTIVMAAILLLIGFAGILSLFLAQAYRSTRQSLSRVQAFSDNLVTNMPIGLVAVNPEGRLIGLNPAAEAILEMQASSAIGKPLQDNVPPALLSIVQELQEGRRIVDREIEYLNSAGRKIPMEVIATPMRDDEETSMGAIFLLRDLSEIRHLQKEIIRNQRLAAIGRLAAGVAHEIRNPLSSIKGFATYFKERYRQVPEDQKTAEIMIQEVDRLNRVISQLLEFARPLQLQKETVSIRGLLQGSLRMIEQDAQRRGILIQGPETTNGDLAASVDADRIKQVLLNLFLNAMDAMQQGGRLTVDCFPDRPAGYLRIVVADTGQGIKEENLAHVFDPFFTTKASGTGLGLAIVHKIIESHGGEIRIESRQGQGTRVSVSLPLEAVRDEEQAQ